MKRIFIVKVKCAIKSSNLEEISTGEIVDVYDPENKEDLILMEEKRPFGLAEDEELFTVSWPLMHRICQVFKWKYGKLIENVK
jgi:hypothetical protein